MMIEINLFLKPAQRLLAMVVILSLLTSCTKDEEEVMSSLALRNIEPRVTGVIFKAQSGQAGRLHYGALVEDGDVPADIAGIQALLGADSVDVTADTEVSVTLRGLQPTTTYKVYAVLAKPNNIGMLLSSIVASATFTTGEDPLPPGLTVSPRDFDFGLVSPRQSNIKTRGLRFENSTDRDYTFRLRSSSPRFGIGFNRGQTGQLTVSKKGIVTSTLRIISLSFLPLTEPNQTYTGRITVSVEGGGFDDIILHVQGRTSRSYAEGDRIYVDRDATGANNGSSWTDAFTSLTVPLDGLKVFQINDAEMWVAEGTYQAPENGFFIRFPVRIYGGFTGTETSLDQRNWNENRTILTGGGTSDHVVRIHTPPNRNDPSDFTVRDIRIDGFDVTEGAALDYSFSNFTQHGAALAIGDLSRRTTHRWIRVKVVNTRIHGNRAAGSGSAIRNSHGPASFINTLIYDNEAGVDANNRFVGGSRGAIIWSDPVQGSDRKVRFINCVIAHNRFGPHNNSSAGIRLSGPNNEIINSIIWSDMSSDFPEQVAGDAGTVVRNNLMKTGTPDNGNIIGMDPMFINSDVSAFDPCLRAGSPAIDAGDNGRVPDDVSTDIKGASRIRGTVDIGACEQ